MSVPRFFIGEPIAPRATGDTLLLPKATAHHAARVLRLAVGDPVVLFDGTGGEHAATLVRIDRHDVEARLDAYRSVERESPLAVTLVQSLLVSDAMDHAVRKAVELGVARVMPVVAQRSQRLSGEDKAERRRAHWQAIAIAACEQCGRDRIPGIDGVQPLEAFLAAPAPGTMAIAGPGASVSLASLARREPPHFVLIGPEGGFTEAEVARAVASGATLVHLGPRVLRADTAAMAALAMLGAVAGDAR